MLQEFAKSRIILKALVHGSTNGPGKYQIKSSGSFWTKMKRQKQMIASTSWTRTDNTIDFSLERSSSYETVQQLTIFTYRFVNNSERANIYPFTRLREN